jgi:Mce-associated membrane protein
VSKRTQTKTVFDRLDEQDDPGEPDTTQTSPRRAAAEHSPNDAAVDGDIASDVESTEVESTDGTPADDRGRSRGNRWRRRATVLVGVAAVAALGLSGFLGWRLKQVDDTAAAGNAALAAARDYAVVLTTLDTNDIDRSYRQALDGATGEFKDEYSQGSAQLRQILIDNRAMGTGLVVDAAIKSATKTRVEVLLFVDQSITNAVNPSPRIDRNRVQITMELVDNRWLASKVDII